MSELYYNSGGVSPMRKPRTLGFCFVLVLVLVLVLQACMPSGLERRSVCDRLVVRWEILSCMYMSQKVGSLLFAPRCRADAIALKTKCLTKLCAYLSSATKDKKRPISLNQPLLSWYPPGNGF